MAAALGAMVVVVVSGQGKTAAQAAEGARLAASTVLGQGAPLAAVVVNRVQAEAAGGVRTFAPDVWPAGPGGPPRRRRWG
jgi:BioD-like phosphotransacetylase family protein